MYIEETGAVGDGDIKLPGGESVEANYDFDHDGRDDAYANMTDDGFEYYIDENDDGAADVLQRVDTEGQLVGETQLNSASFAPAPAAPGMFIDNPDNPLNPLDGGGPDQHVAATEDTNRDGKADTAVLNEPDKTTMVTDVNADGVADQKVEVGNDGQVHVSHHTGGGEWAEGAAPPAQGGIPAQPGPERDPFESAEKSRESADDSIWSKFF